MEEEETRISAEQARVAIARGDASAVDVQDDEEWQKTRVPGSTHIDPSQQEGAGMEEELKALPREARVIVVCEDGRRSAEIVEHLREEGRQASCIEGGMKAWEKEHLPMQPSTDAADDSRV